VGEEQRVKAKNGLGQGCSGLFVVGYGAKGSIRQKKPLPGHNLPEGAQYMRRLDTIPHGAPRSREASPSQHSSLRYLGCGMLVPPRRADHRQEGTEMRMQGRGGTLAAVVLVLWCEASAGAQLAKQGTYSGHFGWYAVGKTVEVEPGHEFFLGEYSGTFLNDAGPGFLHGTSWVCPGVNDRTPGVGQAHGYCTVTDEDGDKAFLV
jgi:hypothetical protein